MQEYPFMLGTCRAPMQIAGFVCDFDTYVAFTPCDRSLRREEIICKRDVAGFLQDLLFLMLCMCFPAFINILLLFVVPLSDTRRTVPGLNSICCHRVCSNPGNHLTRCDGCCVGTGRWSSEIYLKLPVVCMAHKLVGGQRVSQVLLDLKT